MRDLLGNAGGAAIGVQSGLHLHVLGRGAYEHILHRDSFLDAGRNSFGGGIVLRVPKETSRIVDQLEMKRGQRLGVNIADENNGAAAGWLNPQAGQGRLRRGGQRREKADD